MPKAVVTGLALITPAGFSAEEAFRACLDKRCAGQDARMAGPLDRIPLARLPAWRPLDESAWPERSTALAVLAAEAALADAGVPGGWLRRDQSAIVTATSKAGVLAMLAAHQRLKTGQDLIGPGQGGWEWGNPAGPLQALCEIHQPGGETVNLSAACASGLAGLAEAAQLIELGRADTVLLVAADASIHPLFIGAFARLGVLARWRNTPADACRPFDAGRDGFVLGEGAAAMVLQNEALARRPARRPSVTIRACARACLAGHLVSPHGSSSTQAEALRRLLARARWQPEDVSLIHAHGTGTPLGDLEEIQAIRSALGPSAQRLAVLATKPITGHLLGAAGLTQAILSTLAMQAGVTPPTANLTQPDPACDLDCNPAGPRRADLAKTICMATGFGGAVTAVALERS